jgi:hypothetical protein
MSSEDDDEDFEGTVDKGKSPEKAAVEDNSLMKKSLSESRRDAGKPRTSRAP